MKAILHARSSGEFFLQLEQLRNKGFEDLANDVVKADLCNGCGTCVAVCHSGLEMKLNEKGEYTPYIRQGMCVGCGLCYKVCPGRYVPFIQYSKLLFDSHETTFNEGLGNFRDIYFAHSTDFKLRHLASSGGIVSSILTYLLEKKVVQGAIVVGMDRVLPWKAKIKVVKNRGEVYEAAQSKYTVVPVNSFLREVQNANGNFVMVGLPCHIHGLMNLSYHCASDKIKKEIAIKIGLFCGCNVKAVATTFLLDKLGITNYSTIRKLEFRGRRYPGGFLIKLADGKEIFIRKFYYNLIYFLFNLPRCLLCTDLTNELADISVGDAFIKKGKSPMGTIITRTKNGEEIVSRAVREGYLKACKVNPDEVISLNFATLISKKKGSFVRMNLRKKRGFKNPLYDYSYSMRPSLGVMQVAYETFQLLLRRKLFSWLLRNSPLRLSLLFARLLIAGLGVLSKIVYQDEFRR